jgi:hypothetical protein
MPDESFPIEIEGTTYALRFEDIDISAKLGGVEAEISLFAAFHPTARTYDNAALFLWKGLRNVNGDGSLSYAIQQGPPGRKLAYQRVKAFCRQFAGTAGMIVLYGSYHRALIVSGWFGEPQEDAKPKPAGDEEKNSAQPTSKQTKNWLSGFVNSLLRSSAD